MSKIYQIPFDLTAEFAVINGLIRIERFKDEVLSVLRADGRDFYHTGCRLAFLEIMGLLDHGKPVDLLSIAKALQTRGEIKRMSGPTFLLEIVENPVPEARVRNSAWIVRGQAVKRWILATKGKKGYCPSFQGAQT